MPINVECPSCNSRFILQPDLIGKAMRCPTCKDVFTVQEYHAPGANPPPIEESIPPSETTNGVPRADAPAARYQSGSVNDFLPVLESTAEVEVDPVVIEVVEEPEVPVVPMLPEVIPLLLESEVQTDWQTDDSPQRKPTAASNGPTSSTDSTQPTREKRKKRTSSPVVPVEEAEIAEPPAEKPKEIVWSDTVLPPGPREIVWSDDAPLPPTSRREIEPESAEEPVIEAAEPTYRSSRRIEDDEEEEIRPRRKKRGRLAVLVFGVMLILGGLVGGGLMLQNYLANQPERVFEQAKKEYEKGNYDQARKLFEEIVGKHPDYPKYTEAKFFQELSGFRLAIFSVTVASDPTLAIQKTKNFLALLDDPVMQPFAERFTNDVWDTLKKLTEDTFQKAKDVFKLEEPEESERWRNEAANLETLVARFRPKGLEREEVFARIELYRQEIENARHRQQLIAAFTGQLADPDDDAIEAVRKTAKDNGYENDAAILALLREADKKIQGRWVYRRFEEPIPPVTIREAGSTGLLFVPRLDVPEKGLTPSPTGTGTVFFALARGLLYALDENDGHVLWATRVGIDSDALPTRIPASSRNAEMALITVNEGDRSSLTARDPRTGQAIWHQPLPAPGIGQPILVGQRVFVPLRDKVVKPGEPIRRDDKGAVLEFEIQNGFQLGKLALGRPLGSGGVYQHGTGLLFFPAEARGLYVFDVGTAAPDQARLDPTLLGIVNTEHPAGTLRAEPILTNSEGNAPGPRYLILNQADGLNEMRLRAFPFPPPGVPQIPGSAGVEIPIRGWSWFPPYCDSEKLAVVTDRGEFGLFGINQERNNDTALFAIPPEAYRIADARRPARGQVVHADESTFWILARGRLQQLKIGFDAENGLKLVAFGVPQALGEPLHAPQVNSRKDTALVVTQVIGSASSRATAFDPNTGQLRWQRQLGLILQGSPLSFGDSIVMMDQDAGLYRIDPKSLSGKSNTEWLIDDGWLVAPPLVHVVAPPTLLPQADGKTLVAVATVETGTGLRLVVRTYSADAGSQDRSFPLHSHLAGSPILVNGMLVFPLADGLLHRLKMVDGKSIEAGPTWRGARLGRSAKCHLLAYENDFFATDGSRSIQLWRWPVDQDLFESRGLLALTEPIAAKPILIPGGDRQRLMLADRNGTVTLWEADKIGPDALPLRAWRPAAKGTIPAGPITSGPSLERDGKGNARIGYIVDGVHLVWLSPDADAPIWVNRRAERIPGDGTLGTPQLRDGRVYLTDRLGTYRAVDADTGESLGEVFRVGGTASAAGAALPLPGRSLLAPLTDGTILFVAPEKKETKLPLMLIPIGPLGVPFIPVLWE